jgi:chromosome segregation ATPase
VALQVHSLMEQKYSLDAKLSETSTKLGSATGELTAAREELATLRKANKSMDSVSHELEKQLTQATIEMAALKTQVRVVGAPAAQQYTLHPPPRVGSKLDGSAHGLHWQALCVRGCG